MKLISLTSKRFTGFCLHSPRAVESWACSPFMKRESGDGFSPTTSSPLHPYVLIQKYPPFTNLEMKPPTVFRRWFWRRLWIRVNKNNFKKITPLIKGNLILTVRSQFLCRLHKDYIPVSQNKVLAWFKSHQRNLIWFSEYICLLKIIQKNSHMDFSIIKIYKNKNFEIFTEIFCWRWYEHFASA